MKKGVLIICLGLLLFASGCGIKERSEAPVTESPAVSYSYSVRDYFPTTENAHYIYQGEGNEYASYDTYVDYTEDSKLQQRINNSGTETVRVIDVGAEKAGLVYHREECYYRENLLDKTDGSEEILLMAPIEVGTSWTLPDGRVRTITGVDVKAETPSGSYSAVSVETKGSDSWKTTEYYAKNVGLVLTVSEGDSMKVTSALSKIEENAPLVQTVRFYYPNVIEDKIYYTDREISFRTNDITRKVLEVAYKEQPGGGTAKVFSSNTGINSLYLNSDGMVYLDLSGDFLTEMNAGSGYESMILQCLANTFGSYYNAEKLILTVDNKLYESGHIILGKGEYLSVKTDGCVELS